MMVEVCNLGWRHSKPGTLAKMELTAIFLNINTEEQIFLPSVFTMIYNKQSCYCLE